MKKPAPTMRRLMLTLPEDIIRALKARAALEGMDPRDLLIQWVRSWAKPAPGRPGGRP